MSILSIDIGLKNFAYCIVNYDFGIEEWCIYDAGKTPIQYMKFIDELKLYNKVQKVKMNVTANPWLEIKVQ